MSDIEYYRGRAAAERAAAELAENENVREIHEELARLYEALSDDTNLRPISVALPDSRGGLKQASEGQALQ